MSWSHDQVISLIELYRERPCLYQVKSSNYKNKHMRTTAYESMVRELKNIRPGITITEIKSKINGLRTNFATEHRKYLKSKHSGMDEDSLYVPSLWYYEYLLFLLDHIAVRKSTDSIGELSQEFSENSVSLTCDESTTDGKTEQQAEKSNDEDTDAFYYTLDRNIEIINEDENESPSDQPSTSTSMVTPKSYTSLSNRIAGSTKKRKRNHDDSFLDAASCAIKKISTALEQNQNQRNLATEKPDNDHLTTFGNFVVSRLRMIKNDDLVTAAEEKITTILFNMYKESKK